MNYDQRLAIWRAGVVHATLDPRGPGVARLHLVPPKPSRQNPAPSLLIINGTYIVPVGESWAALLRSFLVELTEQTILGDEIDDAKLNSVVDAVANRMHQLYPLESADRFIADLHELVGIIIAIAKNDSDNLPSELFAGFSLRDYVPYMSAPHRLDLIISPMVKDDQWACPLHCLACYARQDAMSVDSGSLLSKRDWLRVIDNCREVGIPMLTFTGGEPLTHPDIVELVDHAKWHVTRLNTSGVLLTTDVAKSLVEASLDGVQITLYSHDAKIHERLVGKKGAHALTVAGIKNAVAAGLPISVNTPLLRANRDYVATLRFLYNLGVNCVTCSGLIATGGAPDQISRGEALTHSELFETLKSAKQFADKRGIEVSFTSPGWLSTEQLSSLGLTSPVCGACLSNMAVLPTGAVVPCQSWLGDPKGLGNILTQPWEKIWNSQLCQQIRQSSAMGDECPLQEVSHG